MVSDCVDYAGLSSRNGFRCDYFLFNPSSLLVPNRKGIQKDAFSFCLQGRGLRLGGLNLTPTGYPEGEGEPTQKNSPVDCFFVGD